MSFSNYRGRLLTESEVADLLKISVRTLQAWRVRGGGPGFLKIGRAVRYSLNEIEEWLAATQRRSTSDTTPALNEGDKK
jgi:excisionase family DNA binding protein